VVDGWQLAREQSPLVRRSRLDLYGHLSHTGVGNADFEAQVKRFEENAISYCGPLPKSAVATKYGEFDALVLMAGAGRYVTGGKAYEYASTGLPIASVHDPRNDTSTALAEYPWWRGAVHADADAYARTFIDVAELAAHQTEEQREEGRNWARRFQRDARLAPRIVELTAAVASQSARTPRPLKASR
jgi:hypothetical protein